MSKILSGGIQAGNVFRMKSYGELVILNVIDALNVCVRFLDTGWETTTEAGDIRKGSVKDRFKPIVYGLGFRGDNRVDYKGLDERKVYYAWHDMLRRCNSPNDSQYFIYKDCSVDPAWFNYSEFARWYVSQVGHYEPNVINWQLDKDWRVPGNRVYSPEACYIVPLQINCLTTGLGPRRNGLPHGLQLNQEGSYSITPRSQGAKKRIVFRYQTVREAQEAYWRLKIQNIRYAGNLYKRYIPEELFDLLVNFTHEDAVRYFGEKAVIL